MTAKDLMKFLRRSYVLRKGKLIPREKIETIEWWIKEAEKE